MYSTTDNYVFGGLGSNTSNIKINYKLQTEEQASLRV